MKGLLAFLLLFLPVLGVKKFLFQTCEQNPFCRRNRHYAKQVEELQNQFQSPYTISKDSLSVGPGRLDGVITKTVNSDIKVSLPFSLLLLDSGAIRFKIDEQQRLDGSIQVHGSTLVNKKRYSLDEWVLNYTLRSKVPKLEVLETDRVALEDDRTRVILDLNRVQVTFERDGVPQITLNDRQFLNFEHWRDIQDSQSPETDKPAANRHLLPQELAEGMWENTFDGHTDKMSRGPESVALDVTFHGYKHVYGIPEHADSFSLKNTRPSSGSQENQKQHSEPYRLFNVDIFEYETQSPMSMYGSIPFMQAQKPGNQGSAGIFWSNAADTYIDIQRTDSRSVHDKNQKVIANDEQTTSTHTHWISEAGVLDVFVFLGDKPQDINQAYTALTGSPALPPMFAIGYHQCRWNYNDRDDVEQVHENFDKNQIPYDVLWLDIEYTDDKKYFTWAEKKFPDHVGMMKYMAKTKRQLVPIIDPHIKVSSGYDVQRDLEKAKAVVLNEKGDVYHGHCWPGESIWVDSMNPQSRPIWNHLFSKSYAAFGGDAPNLHIWNDMNEPSVFSGPETSMQKHNLHHGGWEHRDIHNLFGLTFHNITMDALIARYDGKQRPFILTRSYFAGSQKLGAMWTGDNMAKWEYLEAATPMILTSNVAGMPFSGADVGGFFGDPSPQLLTRWYQAGAFYPFFRAHAHIDSKRREPWLVEPYYAGKIADAIRLRYTLLPSLYTAFHQAYKTGMPVIRPLFYVASDAADDLSLSVDDQFFFGDTGLLVSPVHREDASHRSVYLPDNENYYDYFSHQIYQGQGYKNVPVTWDSIPLLARGGHIFTRKDRYRRSTGLMKYDPYTLVVVLSKSGTAQGSLYVDDGDTFEHEKGMSLLVEFEYAAGRLSAHATGKLPRDLSKLKFEKIIIIGADAPKEVVGQQVLSTFIPGKPGYASVLEITKPELQVNQDWVLRLA